MSVFIQNFQSVIKFLLTGFLIYKLGFFLGMMIVFSIFFSFKIFMRKVFGLEMLRTFDKSFVGDRANEKINISCLMTFKNFDEEKLLNLFKDGFLAKIQRFQRKILYKYGNYYWKKVPFEETVKHIKIVKNLGIKNDQEFQNYAKSQMNNQITVWNNLPFEIEIIPYTGEGGAVLWKFDHTLTDGLGLVNTVCCLADNFDINIFPKILRLNNETKWYIEVLDLLSMMYYIPVSIYHFMMKNIKHSPSPFTKNQHELSGKSRCYHSQFYPVASLEKVRKELKMSFNDIMMSITSKTFKIMANKSNNNQQYEKLDLTKILVPIGKRSLPSTLKESKLANNFTLVYTPLPLIDDIPTQHRKINKSLRAHLGHSGGIYSLKSALLFIYEYLPRNLQLYAQQIMGHNVDMIFSNVPGPASPLYFAGCKMDGISCMLTTGQFPAFLMVYSYVNQFQFFISSDEMSGIDNEAFINQMEEELKNLIATYDNK